jgi:tetratricopeptide (TPR) repeat protein
MGFAFSHLQSVLLGELPPPQPRDCFGRGGLIEKVVGLAQNLKPVALIGAGGIGKTSIALTVLHHDRIKAQFGENRRFIRCDQFPASRTHFLARLSKVIGAGIENPEDLTPLRSTLSSKKMLIILDNAESILDPQGTGGREIYSLVDELCQFNNMCLLITSRITTVPPHCKRPDIPTLSMGAACDIFYSIYGNRGKSSIIDDLLHRLGLHALSIKLLATAASHNAWDFDRLAKEWDAQRAKVLHTAYNESLAATIELSLSSPTFLSLGPSARDLLEVIAFFPQGIDETNINWLFPTISDRQNLFDIFCVLSLTYRSNGFVTMLPPIRDHLGPQDPRSSPLLCATRDHYFSKLSVDAHPDSPGHGGGRWVVSEDINIEHLLNVFTSIDPNMGGIWDASYHFMIHLFWHKPRRTILGSKIEALSDDHPSKPKCLSQLAQLFSQVGNHIEGKRLMTHTLELERRSGKDSQVAATLRRLADTNRFLFHCTEGRRQLEKALEIVEGIGDKIEQAECLFSLAQLLIEDEEPDAAEKATSRAVDLLPEKGQEFLVCALHMTLGRINRSKGERKKALRHYETAIRIASPFDWHSILFWIHYELAELFGDGRELDDESAHIKRAKSHAIDGAMQYQLGRAMQMQAEVWYRERRLEDAKSEALNAAHIYEKLGLADDVKDCHDLLQEVEGATKKQSTRLPGELFEMILHPTLVNFHLLAANYIIRHLGKYRSKR